MAPPDEASWDSDPESGLLDNYDFEITEAKYAPDQVYMGGDIICLQLIGKTNDPDYPENRILIPLSAKWSSKDGGQTIVHESGDPSKFFVKTSLMYAWIGRMVNDFGMSDLLKARGGPRDAKVWPGLKFHVKREVLNWEGLEAGGPKALPTQFLGVTSGIGAGTAPSATSAPAASGETAAEKIERVRQEMEAKKAASSNGDGGSLRDQVLAAIKSEADNAAAQSKALGIEGVTADDTLLQEVLDQDSELWKTARA